MKVDFSTLLNEKQAEAVRNPDRRVQLAGLEAIKLLKPGSA